MTIPPEFQPEADQFPPALRALLDAELAAGNQVVRPDRGNPIPPVGCFLQLERPITTRARASGDGLTFQDFSKIGFPGSFTDPAAVYYLFEPFDPALYVDTNAVRDARNAQVFHPKIIRSDPRTALGRFERSMQIDYEKWHDGVGYDMDALHAATPEERVAIETLLLDQGALNQGVKDWRDVEALAALATPHAIAILNQAQNSPDAEIRLAVSRFAPDLVPSAKRASSLVQALHTARLYGGLSQALDEAAVFHPQEVVEALLEGTLQREGETAVLFAAMLMFVYGKAKEPFDWEQRPFFLRFHTTDAQERTQVFRELCQQIEVDPSRYLGPPAR